MKIEKIYLPEQSIRSAAAVKKQRVKDENREQEDAVAFDSDRKGQQHQSYESEDEKKQLESHEDAETERGERSGAGLDVVV